MTELQAVADDTAPRPAVEAGERFEYIVVGSGAGGGPLAANLARRGARVLLLEAGGDCGDSLTYQVPGFHGLATEDPAMSWEFFVQHYDDPKQQARDSKYRKVSKNGGREGVFYPRAGTLGGCTAHNAMITIVPHDSDWNSIAEAVGDLSWTGDRMREYFERLECCKYTIPRGRLWRFVARVRRFFGAQPNSGRHGSRGWLTTNMTDLTIGLKDPALVRLLLKAAKGSVRSGLELWSRFTRVLEHFDPNDWVESETSPEGLVFTPLATKDGKRTGPRDYVLDVQQRYPSRLTVRTDCLVTRVLFDESRAPGAQLRAIGVEFMEGERLYRASPNPSNTKGACHIAYATRDVVLAAGAFNSPQLLMLSGIGPTEELRRHGIEVIVDRPGVGKNLQDRYEVGVIYEMAQDFQIFDGAPFTPPPPDDAAFRDWKEGRGIYTSNGAVAAIIKRSTRDKPDPDLIVFGLPGRFKGYYPGYSKELLRQKNFFTWAILKAHTKNTGGQVQLRSADPRDEPLISFHSFLEGSDAAGEDLKAIVEGIKFVRGIMQRLDGKEAKEIVPGAQHKDDEQLAQFVRDEAWGHHASCSNKMGPSTDPLAVVDARFRVHGVQGLRVVDASIFPRIPGFFIVTAIYMASEKAADVLLEDAAALA